MSSLLREFQSMVGLPPSADRPRFPVSGPSHLLPIRADRNAAVRQHHSSFERIDTDLGCIWGKFNTPGLFALQLMLERPI